ncbi:MAG TPA: RES domain-containing protein [Puia sp.]|jgi:hypothetical protein|nr:RES domain-containing protein [Puia sp.]
MNEAEAYLHNRLPDIESLKKSVIELEAMDLTKISVEELKEKINSCFPILTYGETTWDSRYHVFRVRRNDNNGFEPFKNISNIGLAPANKTPGGRANNEHDPIFYGSHQGDLALFESCQNLPEYDRFTPQNFTMGIWKVRENATLRLAPLIDNNDVKDVRADIRKVSDFSEQLHMEKLTSTKVKEGSRIIRKFFADQFAKSNIKSAHDYKISAFYADTLRAMNKVAPVKFDGILYPSVAYKYRKDNVAIFPQSLCKLEPIKCFAVISYNFDFEMGTLTKGITAEGTVADNGEIKWMDRL